MRMPWNFLSGRKSKKTLKENDFERLSATSVISLKIRVADSDDSKSKASAPNDGELRWEQDVAAGIVAAPVVDEGTANAVDKVLILSDLDAEKSSASNQGEVRALSNGVPKTSDSVLAVFVEPQADTVSKTEEPIQTEIATLREKPVPQIAVSRKSAVKPPIIDLPNTRNRDANGDMAELDWEIAELRRALSSKLAVQNEQLRQLLERFPD